jgi:hypothetical protein
MFVPSWLEFSDTDFTIKFLFGSLHNFDWLDLHSYGPGENVFVIQFTARTFQILPQAYRRTDWRMLENFLSSRFPDKKVSNHRGYWMFYFDTWHLKCRTLSHWPRNSYASSLQDVEERRPLGRQPHNHNFSSLLMLAVTAGAFLLVAWVATKGLFFL